MLDTVATEVDQFFREASRGFTEAVDAFVEFSNEVVEEIETAIAPDFDALDPILEEWIEPLLQSLLGMEATIDRAVEPITQTVDPILNEHPICVGCRHYHGRMYGGNMLVCAMHPYGIVDGSDTCPDKENHTWGLPYQDDDHWDN